MLLVPLQRPDVWSGRFNFRDMTQPVLDIHGANPTEPCDAWTMDHAMVMNLDMTATVALIKLRLKIALQEARLVKRRFPSVSTKTLFEVLEYDVGGLLARHPEWLADEATIQARLDALCHRGLADLCKGIQQYNPYYLRMVVLPSEKELTNMPAVTYSAGTVEESQAALSHTYSAWAESPWAIQILKGMTDVYEEGTDEEGVRLARLGSESYLPPFLRSEPDEHEPANQN